ncbi:class I SAM-dependent methyltransferase [soil metagenome]
MDAVGEYNLARWKALAEADALFTRPRLDLDVTSARKWIDPDGRFGEISGKDVLCLAAGGGQQSAAFALLGANVTVVDLSPEQLERDVRVSAEYGVNIKTVQADMRDLSQLASSSFDLVHQPYSINFVPDCLEVFGQVARLLRFGGQFWLSFGNPFTMNTRPDYWNGEGYVLDGPYVSGAEITYTDQEWVYDREGNASIEQPVEYRHNLATVINGLIDLGFSIRHLSDNTDIHPDGHAEPGSWDHFVAFAPPWLTLLARLEN